jgi:hypothetical protein
MFGFKEKGNAKYDRKKVNKNTPVQLIYTGTHRLDT